MHIVIRYVTLICVQGQTAMTNNLTQLILGTVWLLTLLSGELGSNLIEWVMYIIVFSR